MINLQSDAKVLATSWPDLKGKTRHEAEEFIKARGMIHLQSILHLSLSLSFRLFKYQGFEERNLFFN